MPGGIPTGDVKIHNNEPSDKSINITTFHDY